MNEKTQKREKCPNKTYYYMQRANVYKNFSNHYHYKNFNLRSLFIPLNQSQKLNESRNKHRFTNIKFFVITRTVTKLSRVTLDFQICQIQLKFH